MLAYSLLGASALFILYYDIKDQMIPLSGVLVFSLAAFLNQVFAPNLMGLWSGLIIAFIFLACQGTFFLIKRKAVMGLGDLVMSPLCGLWLHLSELPNFFLSTGLISLGMAIIWRYHWGMPTFPLAPALLGGLASVFLIRCFFS